MQEVIAPLPALMEGLALSDFVLVVRESQVDPTRVDVQVTSKHQAARHSAEPRVNPVQQHTLQTAPCIYFVQPHATCTTEEHNSKSICVI